MGITHTEMVNSLAATGEILGLIASGKPWPGYACGLSASEYEEFEAIVRTEFQHNQWFTEANVRKALGAWGNELTQERLHAWLDRYSIPEIQVAPKHVAIICAGNIPAVGLHDILSVLLSGHKAMIKLSSDDKRLIPAILKVWSRLQPGLESKFAFVDQKMTGHEAVIATGSNNTSRYFRYYFGKLPHIIRKGRTSLAILDGSETRDELHQLGADVFDYFGLGCRSISKVYLPKGFDLNRIFEAIFPYSDIINHNKYANNYDYNKAVWLLNREELLDNGFILFREDASIASPTASLYYEFYEDKAALLASLDERKEEIQCIAGKGFVAFGNTQKPALHDYADGVDTVNFLLSL